MFCCAKYPKVPFGNCCFGPPFYLECLTFHQAAAFVPPGFSFADRADLLQFSTALRSEPPCVSFLAVLGVFPLRFVGSYLSMRLGQTLSVTPRPRHYWNTLIHLQKCRKVIVNFSTLCCQCINKLTCTLKHIRLNIIYFKSTQYAVHFGIVDPSRWRSS